MTESETNRNETGEDVAAHASLGRRADEEGSIEESVSSDREEVREELYNSATARQAAASATPVGFGRQMIQLALIPAIIVAAVMGVWLLIITLAGNTQSLKSVLDNLDSVPVMSGGPSVADIPGRQQAFRDAITLAGILADRDFTPEERTEIRTRLNALAQKHRDGDPTFFAFLMKSVGSLADPQTISLFAQLLESGERNDQYAAVQGLYAWQQHGDIRLVQPLTQDLIPLLQAEQLEVRTLAASLIGGAADPSNMEARDALARLIDQSDKASREAAWTAGCSLAALGDERGIPVVLTLLDREWLASQTDPSAQIEQPMSEASQDKIIKTVLNVLVRFVPAEDETEGSSGRFVVRIDDPSVWTQVEALAENDPSEEVRAVAQRVLDVRAGG